MSSRRGPEPLRQWLADRTGEATADSVIDNGSRLSCDNRVSAHLRAGTLRDAHGLAG